MHGILCGMDTSKPRPPALCREAALRFAANTVSLPEGTPDDPLTDAWKWGKITDVDYVNAAIMEPEQNVYEERRAVAVMYAKGLYNSPTFRQDTAVDHCFEAFRHGRFDFDALERLLGDWSVAPKLNETYYRQLLPDYAELHEVGST